MTSEPDQLLDFARRYTEAWCSQEPTRVAEHYARDGSLTINGGAPSVGRAAITEVARSFMTAFPDMQVLLDDLVVQDGGIEYHWTLVGANTGPGGTGNRVRISGFEEWTLGNDGLVAESQGHYDQAEYDPQLEHGVEEPSYTRHVSVENGTRQCGGRLGRDALRGTGRDRVSTAGSSVSRSRPRAGHRS